MEHKLICSCANQDKFTTLRSKKPNDDEVRSAVNVLSTYVPPQSVITVIKFNTKVEAE
jgi:hypothetical protein